ncbi:hypothetical protein NRIC_26610 [Enterococcus florum]|uniref:Gram-positive pilin subunit D1 N-terminal domain-containing protein n=1 Tax=Enterococcus florum TaxID=2480627 RepID=A0A4P5PA05_9ENTE|nr:pilin N-terminal domain-containing protein [Enterococcus florum]GCF94770.1 hypothetical protein NRIC_26610 [Enterococcus florum]
MKKIVILAGLTLLSLLMMLNTALIPSLAAGQATITLHKKGFDGVINTEINNEGQLLDPEDAVFKGAQGVNGVSFSVYDVTEEYNNELAQGLTENEIKQKMAQMTVEQLEELQRPVVAQGTTSTVDQEEGLWTFTAATQIEPTAYLIIETASEETEIESSLPILLVLDDSQAGQHIHLYPKNILLDEPEPPLESTPPSETPTRPGLPNTQGTTPKTSTTTRGNLPQTNDQINQWLAMGGMVLFLAGILLVHARKQKYENE